MALMDTANPSQSHSPLFVHSLMLIDGDEPHERLAGALKILDDWIEKLSKNGFMYCEKLYKVTFVLTGD